MGPKRIVIPPPLTDQVGCDQNWPWSSPNTSGPDQGVMPRVSVITPSFNQAAFLEKTIRSVLLQGYENLEYIVIDGGSTDGSKEIISHYSNCLSWWESGPDRGQCHAINKGLARATGEILCWLNSDDYFLPGALETAGRTLAAETCKQALVGHVLKVFTTDCGQIGLRPATTLKGCFEGRRRLLEIWKPYQMHQAAIFWRRELTEQVGLLDEQLNLVMDFDYWARMSRYADFVNIDQVLAACHYHSRAKTGDGYAEYHRALRRRVWRYWGSPLQPEFWYLASRTVKHCWLPKWRRD